MAGECLQWSEDRLESGQGPRLLGTYPEGRVEEHLDIRIAAEEEMLDPKFTYELRKKVVAMHSLSGGEEEDEVGFLP